jgi:ABC transporter substrate binding protein
MIRRREFIRLLGGGAAAWPLVARAQSPGKLAKIGYLGSSTALAQSQWTAAFVQRFRELGWIEGRNVTIEYRWAEERNERFGEIAAEFVRLKVDVIVTAGTAPVLATKRATSVIPIVFPLAGDPVGNGLVVSLARPGGNITGCRSRLPILEPRDSNFCAKLLPLSVGWRLWPMSVMPPPRCVRALP